MGKNTLHLPAAFNETWGAGAQRPRSLFLAVMELCW